MGEIEERFNRYIVECKGTRAIKTMAQTADLIDTLWNVKMFSRYLTA